MLMLPSGAGGLVAPRQALADLRPSEVLHLPMNLRQGSRDQRTNKCGIGEWKTMVTPCRQIDRLLASA